MIQSIRRAVAVPHLGLEAIVTASTAAAFVWLLANGFIQPIAIYLLELYLTF